MTRKHFEAIAAFLRGMKPGRDALNSAWRTWEDTVNGFVALCAQSNPRFDAHRFRLACGMED